jgi:hypothetical protein
LQCASSPGPGPMRPVPPGQHQPRAARPASANQPGCPQRGGAAAEPPLCSATSGKEVTSSTGVRFTNSDMMTSRFCGGCRISGRRELPYPFQRQNRQSFRERGHGSQTAWVSCMHPALPTGPAFPASSSAAGPASTARGLVLAIPSQLLTSLMGAQPGKCQLALPGLRRVDCFLVCCRVSS